MLADIPALTVDESDVLNIRMGRKIDISFLSEQSLKKLHSKEIIFVQQHKELIALGNIQGNFFKPKKVFKKEK